jgi:hypothetical protein
MNKPKYIIGEAVYVDFSGVVEGVPVKVRKHLWVFGVQIGVDAYPKFAPVFVYKLSENPPIVGERPGKFYEKQESEIIGPVEPVVAEVTKAQAEEKAQQQQNAQKIIDVMTKHHETP